MNSKRTSKQYYIINEKGIRIKYGTMDKRDPSVIFIRAKGDIKPYVKKTSYANDVKELKEGFRNMVKSHLAENERLLPKRCICNVEITDKGLAYNKHAHLRYEVFVVPETKKPIEEYESDFSELANKINGSISEYLKCRGIECF